MRSPADQNEIRISLADVQDVAALSRLGQHTFTDKFGHLYRKADLIRFLEEDHGEATYQAFIESPDYQLWKAETSSGQLVGYALASETCGLPVDDMPEHAGEVKRLYVTARHQGDGLGRLLMDTMMAWLDRNGPRPIYLSVYKFNEGAQRFYGRYGFSLVKEYEFMVGDHADPEYIFGRLV